jgi:heme a synthase
MKLFRHFNLASLVLCFIVIVFGAYVRLSDAGLGCPDWPGCYGHLTIPQAEHEVVRAEQAFPERPVEAPKAWKEMIHRYLASTLGFMILVMAAWSRLSRDERMPKGLPVALLALVIFQGILGMWTVTWQLKPLAVCAHLLGGMSLAALLFWQWLAVGTRLAEPEPGMPSRLARNERQAWAQMQEASNPPATAPGWLRGFAALGLIVLAVQIFLGGWTSSNYAALACPDLPTCHGQWWPDTDVKEAFTLWRGLGINYEYGVLDSRARVTIHLFHRVGAVVTTVVLGLLALCLLRWRAPVLRRHGQVLLAALGLQVVIGISVVAFQLPLWLADAHNAGAALLLLAVVAVNYALRQPVAAT